MIWKLNRLKRKKYNFDEDEALIIEDNPMRLKKQRVRRRRGSKNNTADYHQMPE